MSGLPWIAKDKQWSLRGGKFYHSTTWRKLRAKHIQSNPLCVKCKANGLVVDCSKGGVVDHIVEINKGGHATDSNNLQTLCASCHGKKNKQAYK
jgi:5-methylcytosine-specific restriction protein A